MTSNFHPHRRHVLAGAAGLLGLALTPEQAAASAAIATAADWQIAFADLEGDMAPRVLQKIRGKAPEGLAGYGRSGDSSRPVRRHPQAPGRYRSRRRDQWRLWHPVRHRGAHRVSR